MNTKMDTGLRIFLGLILVVFGMNNFLQFMPQQEMSAEIMTAFGGLMAVKFIMPTVAVIEIVAGLSILTKKFSLPGLIALLPISYGAVMFHLVLGDFAGIMPAVIVATLNIALLLGRKNKLAPFFLQVRMVNLGFMAVFMTEQLNQHERLLFSKGSLS